MDLLDDVDVNLERRLFTDSWIKMKTKAKESEFTTFENVEVLCATWNVNVKKPTEDLSGWLNVSNNPAFVAIGIQEMDMSAEGVIFREMESRAAPWEAIFLDGLNKQYGGEPVYSTLASKQLGGVFLVVYVHQKYAPIVKEVQISMAITGILGVVANKGGVAVRVKLHDSTFVFLNAHFNAHQANVETRNQDFMTIESGLIFHDPSTVKEGDDPTFLGTPLTLNDHDNLFWVGDFNYRIDLPDVYVRQRIEEEDWETLWAADQLHLQQKRGKVFVGWQEATINFAPTYKYDNNSTSYDTGSKRRCPAWCDRVLWKSDYVKNKTYERFELFSSDHRPVSAKFDVAVKTVNQAEKSRILGEIQKELAESANSPPHTTLTQTEVSFKNLRFGIPRSQEVTLSNVGTSIVRWNFVPKLKDNEICQSWLTLSPTRGMLAAGEEAKITFTAKIGPEEAHKLVEETFLEDLVVLKVMNESLNGKDYFISFSGTRLRSVFGNSLTSLVNQPYPIRADRAYPSLKLKIPKEMWRLCDWLYKNGMYWSDIFIRSGKPAQMEILRECLDTGADFPTAEIDAYSVGETLLQFLNCVREPLVPYEFYSSALNVCNNFTLCKQLVSKFPEVNYNVFYYLMAFLREFLAHGTSNKLTPEKLAIIFCEVVFRPPSELAALETDGAVLARKKSKSTFLLHFLIPLNHMRPDNTV